MEKVFLAADLGGTNLRMAAVDRAGTIVSRNRMSTPSDGNQDDIVSAILSVIDEFKLELAGNYEFAAFGAAMPAIVNSHTGTILRSPNLPQLNDLDFEALFTKHLGIPVVLENDANSAA
ncbi:MAG: ROK family protein, partial [Pyrinomonadaceae bacterium]